MSAQIRSRSLYAAVLCALLGAAACSDDTLVGPSRAAAPHEAQRDVSVSSPAIALIAIEVSAGKGSKQPLLYNIPIVDGRGSGRLATPAGEGRQLVFKGYDIYGTLTYRDSSPLNAIRVGRNEPLNVTIRPVGEGKPAKLSLDVVGEESLGGGSIVVETAKELLEGQTTPMKATVYDRDGRRMDVDPREIHWAVSDPRVGRPNSDDRGSAWLDALRYGNFELVAIYKDIVWKRPFVALTDSYVQVSAGFDFTCGRRTSGAVSCWGGNANFQLGNNSTQTCNYSDPCNDRRVTVLGGRSYKSISSGRSSVCGIETSGAVSCWGKNDKGQLGVGYVSTSILGPTSLNTALTFSVLSSGGDHSCAIVNSSQRQAVCWGWNSVGQLGDGNPGNYGYPNPQQQTSPVAVAGGHAWGAIGAGKEHTCGVTTAGIAMCWGSNYYGEIGVGPFVSVRPVPDTVNTAAQSSFTGTFSGPDAYGTCWLRVGALGSCQGANSRGQAGKGSSSTTVGQPANLMFVGTVPSLVGIALGTQHACATDTANNLWCWGDNTDGQIGLGINVQYFLNHPQQVGTYKFTSVTSGGNHSCGLATTGEVYCWGKNDRGQLGIGSHGASTPTPTLIVP